MTSPLLPGDRPTPRSLLPVPLLTAALSAVGVVVAVLLGPASARGALTAAGVIAALLLCAAVTWATHAVLTARALRGRLEEVSQDVGRLLQERARQAEEARRQHERLTGELTRERARLSADLDQERARLAKSVAAERERLNDQHATATARLTQEHTAERARLAEEHATELTRLRDEHAAELSRLADEHAGELRRRAEEHDAHTARLVQQHTDERDRLDAELKRLGEERARLSQDRDRHIGENARLAVRLREADGARAAALSATANAAGRMQALSTGMLADLRAMEDKHHDEEVLADLLHLDHRTAQAGRLADSVAVLTGARSGRRWARPIRMESILRGAMGRISGYRRVRVHSAADTAVAGHAAEGVMHALAELLDNAANFSPPTAEVHVYVEEVPAGVIVSVEDSGLVMGEAQLRRAERAVSGETSGLGGLTGTRLGLAVVGRLARRYGLRVSYRPSARGGTGVLMLVPQDILVSPDAPHIPPAGAPAPTGTRTGAHTRPARPARSEAEAPAGAAPGPSAPGLPQRTGTRPAEAPAVHPADATAPTETGPAATSATTSATASAGHSYAAHRAGADLDPDPVPTHESPDRPTDPSPNTGTGTGTGTDASAPEAPPLGLPRRRRGRTLAEAERTRSAGTRATTPRPTAPTAEETRARTARFSSFRQAVRATAPDDAEPCTETDTGTGTGTGTSTDTGASTAPLDTPTPTPTPVTPEGDTTS
ncbi:ATP-binding protein [Streptomyces sp. NWU339]|uniref:ATP-binding protein n=1 Tax=Streptomyces sp. NWU339 TaxID=2185284 RepID=UPI000D683F7C|nr:ATP-binding protein [Streptomyces sp. NWU339]PWI09483.1 ATP-binding protein [Streptomyces sp. NWU339]